MMYSDVGRRRGRDVGGTVPTQRQRHHATESTVRRDTSQVMEVSLLEVLERAEELRGLILADIRTCLHARGVCTHLRSWAHEQLPTIVVAGVGLGSSWLQRAARALAEAEATEDAESDLDADGPASSSASWPRWLRLIDLRGAPTANPVAIGKAIDGAKQQLRALWLDGADCLLPALRSGWIPQSRYTWLPMLVELSARECPGLDDEAASRLGVMCPKLRRLRLSHDGLSSRGWGELLLALPELEELDVSTSRLDDAALLLPGSLLSLAMHDAEGGEPRRSICSLRLSRCPGVTDAALRTLLRQLLPPRRSTRPRPRTPDPRWLKQMQEEGFDEASIRSRRERLRVLNIDRCGVRDSLRAVAEAASAGALFALHELGLCESQLRSAADPAPGTEQEREQAGWLRSIVSHCPALQRLDVRGCVAAATAAVLAGRGQGAPPLANLRQLQAGFLLPVLSQSLSRDSLPGQLETLAVGLGARANDVLLQALAASSSAGTLRTLRLSFGVFEEPGLHAIASCEGLTTLAIEQHLPCLQAPSLAEVLRLPLADLSLGATLSASAVACVGEEISRRCADLRSLSLSLSQRADDRNDRGVLEAGRGGCPQLSSLRLSRCTAGVLAPSAAAILAFATERHRTLKSVSMLKIGTGDAEEEEDEAEDRLELLLRQCKALDTLELSAADGWLWGDGGLRGTLPRLVRHGSLQDEGDEQPDVRLRRLLVQDRLSLAAWEAEQEFGPRSKGKKGKGKKGKGKGKGKRKDSGDVYEAIRGRAQKAGADPVAEYQFARCG
eukprot:COSAG04_NODE_599_length_12233_cov_61.753750_8_plen_784_part_00